MNQVIVRRKDHLTILSIEVWSEDDMKFGINPEQTIAVVICNTDAVIASLLATLVISTMIFYNSLQKLT